MKDKLARRAMRSEKMAGLDLKREKSMKLKEDFKGEMFRILKTSETMTGGWEWTAGSASGRSGNTKDGERRLS